MDRLGRIVLCLLFFIPTLSLAETPQAFFARYVQLGANFDIAVIDLYADDARITSLRRYPNGREQSMRLDGVKWKSVIAQVMSTARGRGDVSEYSAIQMLEDGDRIKIRANRYSVLKCYTDSRYYMTIAPANDGRWQIVEEHMEIQTQSECPAANEGVVLRM